MSLITSLWSKTPGKFFCISTKTGGGKWKDTFFAPEDFGKIRAFLRDNDDKDIYFCPHGFNRRVRQKEEAVIPNMLWADLDFADPKRMKPRPTIAIESSPGRFVGIWLLKGKMTESMNRRLSYKVGADKGGWDLTQVLRFPGTRNYKYKSQPKVRILWDDGPKWSLKGIEKFLPSEDTEDNAEKVSAKEVFEKYQDTMPSWLRRELLAKKMAGRVDRSEMLWKIENECIEVGMTMEEAFAVIKASVWNKFAGRRSENDQLKREIQKVVDHQFNEKPKGIEKLHRKSDAEESDDQKHPERQQRFLFKPMKDVEREEMDFIWEPYMARGEVTIVEGDPGLGKSYLVQMVSGSIATGQRLPKYQGKGKKNKGAVVYFDIENSGGTVTKPRLEDNGFKDLDNYYQIEEGFGIDDEEALNEILENMDVIHDDQGIAVVVFDTLNTYIGRADTHKASESTQAFGIFKRIAKAYNCSVVVLRHLTKGGGSAMYRGQGSVAFSGSARVVISVGVDPNDTETRAMAITKINFAKAPPALTFRIEERPKGRSEFLWGEFVDLTSQEIMDAAAESRKEGKVGDGIQEAMEFIEATITGVELDHLKLYRMGEKRSIPKKMIERAAMRMKIIKKKSGNAELWTIKPPKKKDDED